MLTFRDRLSFFGFLGAGLAVLLLDGGVPLIFALIGGATIPLLASAIDPGDPA